MADEAGQRLYLHGSHDRPRAPDALGEGLLAVSPRGLESSNISVGSAGYPSVHAW
jgi:hypothetical protein